MVIYHAYCLHKSVTGCRSQKFKTIFFKLFGKFFTYISFSRNFSQSFWAIVFWVSIKLSNNPPKIIAKLLIFCNFFIYFSIMNNCQYLCFIANNIFILEQFFNIIVIKTDNFIRMKVIKRLI